MLQAVRIQAAEPPAQSTGAGRGHEGLQPSETWQPFLGRVPALPKSIMPGMSSVPQSASVGNFTADDELLCLLPHAKPADNEARFQVRGSRQALATVRASNSLQRWIPGQRSGGARARYATARSGALMPSAVTAAEIVQLQMNAEPRVPFVYCGDISGSMAGQPIHELNAGLRKFQEVVNRDSSIALRAEIAVTACTSEPYVAQGFVPAPEFRAPQFTAGGSTPLAEAGELSFALLFQRLSLYEQCDLDNLKPFVLIVTDGQPSSSAVALRRFAEQVRALETSNTAAVFFVGTEEADLTTLHGLSVRRPLRLLNCDFRAMFSWVAESLRSISQSMPGEEVELPNPFDSGWASL